MSWVTVSLLMRKYKSRSKLVDSFSPSFWIATGFLDVDLEKRKPLLLNLPALTNLFAPFLCLEYIFGLCFLSSEMPLSFLLVLVPGKPSSCLRVNLAPASKILLLTTFQAKVILDQIDCLAFASLWLLEEHAAPLLSHSDSVVGVQAVWRMKFAFKRAQVAKVRKASALFCLSEKLSFVSKRPKTISSFASWTELTSSLLPCSLLFCLFTSDLSAKCSPATGKNDGEILFLRNQEQRLVSLLWRGFVVTL